MIKRFLLQIEKCLHRFARHRENAIVRFKSHVIDVLSANALVTFIWPGSQISFGYIIAYCSHDRKNTKSDTSNIFTNVSNNAGESLCQQIRLLSSYIIPSCV